MSEELCNPGLCVCVSINPENKLAPVWCIDQLPVGHREVYWSDTLPTVNDTI